MRSHTKDGPDRFNRFDVYWIQTNTQTPGQTDKQAKYTLSLFSYSNIKLSFFIYVRDLTWSRGLFLVGLNYNYIFLIFKSDFGKVKIITGKKETIGLCFNILSRVFIYSFKYVCVTYSQLSPYRFLKNLWKIWFVVLPSGVNKWYLRTELKKQGLVEGLRYKLNF